MYLTGDRLYTTSDKTLYVYLVSDKTSLIATYSLSNDCYSGLSGNRLYLGEEYYLEIFDLATSLTQPLTLVTQIKTKDYVLKILMVGNQLLLGEGDGYLEVFDIKTSMIANTH